MLALLGAGGSALLGARLGRTPVRHEALRMQAGMLPTGGSDLESNNEQGNTFWATLDGRSEDGISPDGMVPPGDDLIEADLKRVFNIDPDEEGMAGDSGFSDMDEIQVLPPAPHMGQPRAPSSGVPWTDPLPRPTHRLAYSPSHSPSRPFARLPARSPAHPLTRPARLPRSSCTSCARSWARPTSTRYSTTSRSRALTSTTERRRSANEPRVRTTAAAEPVPCLYECERVSLHAHATDIAVAGIAGASGMGI